MSDNYKEPTIEFDEDNIIEMIDEDGETHYFYEEMQFEADGNRYAILSFFNTDEKNPTNEEDVLNENETTLAKIVKGEDGEDEYLTPTDEEFTTAVEAYEKFDESDFE
ncbi:DUF1292 domain-containing protein [Pectinatus cerevisiiphilus]|uniref:Uncharacterized protein DUF1292 n=1 Tax=Pectinatus cerevisiiphilus TaxID=86956 RepID=A0A4R3K9U9_9FIRM|nr:DUF1292 domain-containing protein [Pectinatus cerevisiiphilus]TCS79663.1 uncharacterized protein DUF1292 [Pectinatus cerevisiiphilus]